MLLQLFTGISRGMMVLGSGTGSWMLEASVKTEAKSSAEVKARTDFVILVYAQATLSGFGVADDVATLPTVQF
jgi:hypothetical protein